MSKSGLEKFLYALYSLDSSDLPTPLSRIEELYNCWVTGTDVPTFEPLSRVEKYLMAILGVYDANELPNPISRVEVLLHKLATGDDNLDDVKSFLSEHEELLAEIIRNGGAGGNIDIEYVLYTLSTEFNTLYNTAEKPVKSAILKGQTLVNITTPHLGGYNDGGEVLMKPTQLKSDTKYYIKVVDDEFSLKSVSFRTKDWVDRFTYASNGIITLTTPSNDEFINYMYLVFMIAKKDGTTKIDNSIRDRLKFVIVEYQKGMENWDIPYFEGMSSVKMPVLTTSNEDGTKTNILTVNEEVELHGISDVRDELNPFTGELTQRIGEFVFDGDERFKMSTSDNNAFFYHELGENILIPSFTKKMISNNLLDYSDYAAMKNTENSMYTNGKNIYIHLTNDINSVSLLQTYLANNPIKIIACLSNESVKTVDLSVVDQDGNDTKLKTFNDLTHVTLSSEGLIPEAELEVATKNEEVLNTMSLEMDDISTTQTTLEETSNTQSENVDATMMATTEIYEQLL